MKIFKKNNKINNSLKNYEKLLKDVLSPINKTSDELKLIDKLRKKHGDDEAGLLLIKKSIEDSVLNNLINKSIPELKEFADGFKNFFEYYGQDYGMRLINDEILKKKRLQKLEKILKD